jgi:RimJ/RimL family protein N-acetyltransferase
MVTETAMYNKTESLKNGLQVRIRAIRPDDKCLIVKAFNELEPESIYSRFFQRKNSLSEKELQKATEMDFENDVGLVVTIGEEDTETIIGTARYLAYNTPDGTRCAEVAFTVEEDYHSQGMATILIQHLTAIARQKGVKRFTAEVLAQNISMLKVFRHSGLPVRQENEQDVVHVTMSLVGEDF